MKAVVIGLLVVLTGCSFLGPKPKPVSNDETRAVTAAKALFDQKYASYSAEQRQDLLIEGPCLSNEIIPGWVADIAHQPRTQKDNSPVNQCDAYREGRAKHFVELDPDGHYLRAY